MSREALPQSRAERLIATARLVLALASLVAIYVDPIESSRQTMAPALLILFGYVVYAAALCIWNFLSVGYDARLPLLTHSFDLVIFTIINFLTEGPASPFFACFVFAVICAILRFGRKGTIVTVAVAVFVYFSSAGYAASLAPADFQLNRFLIRAVYLTVVGSLLIYLADYQQRANRDLSLIATWPRLRWDRAEQLVEHSLAEASKILNAGRVLLAYEWQGEPYAYLGRWGDRGFTCEEQQSGTARLLLGPSLDSSLVTSSASRQEHTFVRSGPHLVRATSIAVPDEIVREFRIETMAAVTFGGEHVRGRLFFLDREESMQEDLTLGKIVAEIISSRLEHFHFSQQVQRGAVAEERVRLGRNLHDSILQSLTGAALQLQTVPRLMSRDPAAAVARINEIQTIIAGDQRELRWFIDQLNSERRAEHQVALYDLEIRLDALRQRFKNHWNIEVLSKVDPAVHLIPDPVRFEVYSLVSEAVANAAKHAAATNVGVHVKIDGTMVRIAVTDDGRGFPFEGRHDLRDLFESCRGPVTLKERVASLRGDMVIDSSQSGSHIDISLPLHA
jgi:signal transduction histidine kinase